MARARTPRAPRRRTTLTALPPCAPRVRSDHWEEHFARTLAPSSWTSGSLASRTLSAAAWPVTAAPAPLAALTSLPTIRPVRRARDRLPVLSVAATADGTAVAAIA